MERVRAAIIGFGLAGRHFHAPLIAAVDSLELAAIVTSRAEEARALYPQARILATPEAAIADPDIDLIVLASPHQTHVPLGLAALRAGKHVVIDKPMALTAEDGAALVTEARAAGRLLSAFHNRRWDSDFLTVQRVLGEGALGSVRLAELRWDRFRPIPRGTWREDGGIGFGLLVDLGPHLLDQALQLFGPPEALTADLAVQRAGSDCEDYFEITLHYPNGLRVIASAASLVSATRPRFAIHGSAASLVLTGIDRQEALLRAGGSPDDPGYGVDHRPDAALLYREGEPPRPVPVERGDWRCFYEQLADAVRTGTPPPVPGQEALASLRLIELARESARSGRTLAIAEQR